jgi:hypothetical protein
MDKKVLSEIDIYLGTVDMPKYFEINRDELKSNYLLLLKIKVLKILL